MSELIAEARVLVTPDTAAFRQLLTAQLQTATAGVTATVPVTPVVAPGSQSTASAANAARTLAREETASASAIRGANDAKQQAIRTNAAYTRSLAGVSSGAASAGLSLVGLRGATLAASGPFLAGAAAAISFGKAMQIATSFNSEIAVLGATTGATGEQLARASEAAREFGRDITLPGVTAGDAAQTITEFAKAGLDLNDAIAATRGGLQLAQAAQLSYADAVTLSANALNAFGLSGGQAVRVADTLANAANLAQGGIEDTALALRQAAGAAAVVGVNFEDTTALLTLLARNGLTGSDAGTALRTAFLRLVNPSKEANKILEDLNVQLRDINGNVRPEVFADFAAAQRDLTQAQQQANAAIVFGQDAFRAFGFLGREGRAGLDQVQAGLEQTGTAARIAAARMTGLRGAQENLSNQLTDLGLTIGNLADGPLTVLVDTLGDAVGLFNDSATAAIDFGEALASIVPPAPPGSGFLGDLAKDVIGFTNPVTGVTNPIANIKRFGDLFGDESENTADDIKNGGVELRDAIEESGREAARGAVSFQDQIIGGINAAFSAVREAIQQRQQEIRGDQLTAARQGANQQAGLEEVFNQIVGSGGSTQEQIANLKRQADIQARIIREAGPNAAGVLLEARREAQAKLASINQQRTALEQQIASDAKAAADERRRIQEQAARDADQSVLDSQAAARQAQQNRITQAEDTPALQDDIQRTQSLRALLQRQIAQVRTRISDEQARQQAIEALRQQVFVTTQAIKSLKAAEEQQRQENREAIFERTAENAALRTQIAEARDADESVIVRFIDAEIAIARAAVRRAKQANKGILAAQLELENLRKKKRDLLNEAKDTGDEGNPLTAFDILQQNAQTFAATGGNLVTGNQPFAGPTGFTADVAQFLTARPNTTVTVEQKQAATAEQLQRQMNEQLARLILALEQNTAVQSGNFSTNGYADIQGARGAAMASFYLSRQARQLTEAENP